MRKPVICDLAEEVSTFLTFDVAPGTVVPDYSHAQRMATQCDEGICKYATPPRGGGCVGHRGVLSWEDPLLVVRYRQCPKHLAWMHHRRLAAEEAKSQGGFRR